MLTCTRKRTFSGSMPTMGALPRSRSGQTSAGLLEGIPASFLKATRKAPSALQQHVHLVPGGLVHPESAGVVPREAVVAPSAPPGPEHPEQLLGNAAAERAQLHASPHPGPPCRSGCCPWPVRGHDGLSSTGINLPRSSAITRPHPATLAPADVSRPPVACRSRPPRRRWYHLLHRADVRNASASACMSDSEMPSRCEPTCTT